MFGTRRLRLLVFTLGWIALAGCSDTGDCGSGVLARWMALAGCSDTGDCGSGVLARCGAPVSEGAQAATVAWSDASGPVVAYRVFVSRNNGIFTAQEDVPTASATVRGDVGERVRIRVAGLDAEGSMGPLSDTSVEILFTPSGVVAAATAQASSTVEPGSVVAQSAPVETTESGQESEDIAAGQTASPEEKTRLAEENTCLDFDGTTDLLWEDAAPSLALHLTGFADGSLCARVSFLRPDAGWWVVATDDFDGDGMTDLLWESEEGMLAFSPLPILVETAPVAPLAPVGELGADEVLVSTGDHDGNGLADLHVWDEVSGERFLWLMNAGEAADIVSLEVSVAAGSSVAATGDFDGDRRTDLLWRGPEGALTASFMDGSVAAASLDVAGSAVEILGAGDFDADGDDDLVYRESASDVVAVLVMDGRRKPATWDRVVDAGPGWQVGSVGDFDGDGAADLFWLSETDSLIGFYEPEEDAPQFVHVDPEPDWLLVSFAQ